MKKGIRPRPRSCIAGRAGKNLAPSARVKSCLDQAIKNAANGILRETKELQALAVNITKA